MSNDTHELTAELDLVKSRLEETFGRFRDETLQILEELKSATLGLPNLDRYRLNSGESDEQLLGRLLEGLSDTSRTLLLDRLLMLRQLMTGLKLKALLALMSSLESSGAGCLLRKTA